MGWARRDLCSPRDAQTANAMRSLMAGEPRLAETQIVRDLTMD